MKDYQIIQRDDNEQGVAHFSGSLPDDACENSYVYGRVYSEDDNLAITPFVKCVVKERTWEVSIPLPTGGLYRFEAKIAASEVADLYEARRIQLVRHFGVGDVYVIAGQSNIAGYGRDTAYDPPELGVHLYANNGKWTVASHPLNDSTDTIYPENREDSTFTSPALSFARVLKNKLNIPIGLVQASLGGTTLSVWHPEEDGTLYRSMVRRIAVVGKVKGILWYQGCSDTSEELSANYYERFKRMVELWREELGEIPFITAQLNRWAQGGNPTIDNDRCWGTIRDAQRRIAQELSGVCIVPTLDLPLSDGIHNSSGANVTIGYRMAIVAMKYIYGKPGQEAPNVCACEYIDNTHLRVKFNDAYYIHAMDMLADGLDVEDESGIIACKRAVGDLGALIVETEHPYTLPAKFHAYWRCNMPSMIVKDLIGMPMLACYNVEITRK